MPILSYLLLHLKEECLAAFEQDLAELLALAPRQPGFRWVETYQQRDDPCTVLILSEWESLEELKAWEHSPRHDEAILENTPRFSRPEVHARYVPFVKPSEG